MSQPLIEFRRPHVTKIHLNDVKDRGVILAHLLSLAVEHSQLAFHESQLPLLLPELCLLLLDELFLQLPLELEFFFLLLFMFSFFNPRFQLLFALRFSIKIKLS